ncbi:MAG: helix-turn-helix domain-containing protein [Desulfobacterales bacterium]|jgi:transcriptional regulator GlxA family with amidase domain
MCSATRSGGSPADVKTGRRTFEQGFKAATGDPPLIYLQRILAQAAKRMLEDARLSLNKITYRVGYEDSSSIRKVFRNKPGYNPAHTAKNFSAL